MTRRGWLLFAAMSVIWGVPYLLIKVAVRELDPAVLVFARTGIAALVLLPVAAARGALAPVLRRWRVLVVYALVEVALPWWLLSDAERHVTSSFAGLLIAVVPLVGALLARERIDVPRAVGLAVGMVGVGALLGLDVHGGVGQLRGIGEVLLTAVGYATGPLIVARSLADVPSIGVNGAALGVTALLWSPVAVLSLPSHVPAASVLGSVAVLALVCTAAAFLVFFALIAEAGPARATVITYVNPAVAVVLGVALLGERFTVGMAVGFPLVLAGSWLATRRTRAGQATAADASAGVPVAVVADRA